MDVPEKWTVIYITNDDINDYKTFPSRVEAMEYIFDDHFDEHDDEFTIQMTVYLVTPAHEFEQICDDHEFFQEKLGI